MGFNICFWRNLRLPNMLKNFDLILYDLKIYKFLFTEIRLIFTFIKFLRLILNIVFAGFNLCFRTRFGTA